VSRPRHRPSPRRGAGLALASPGHRHACGEWRLSVGGVR
jgi:hypothetical protein